MGPWLPIAGPRARRSGSLTIACALRRGPRDAYEQLTTHGHDHEHGVGVGWLLLAPIAALLLVAPPTLGSYGVDRGAAIDVRSGEPSSSRYRGTAAPVPMTLLEYGQRAFDHDGRASRRDGPADRLRRRRTSAGGSGSPATRSRAAPPTPTPASSASSASRRPAAARPVGHRDRDVPAAAAASVPRLAATSIVEIAPPEDPYE